MRTGRPCRCGALRSAYAMSVLVLDSEAMWSLTRQPGVNPKGALAALTAARENNWDVVVPAAVLAELYWGGPQQQAIDATLSAHGDIAVTATDQRLAPYIGTHARRAAPRVAGEPLPGGRRSPPAATTNRGWQLARTPRSGGCVLKHNSAEFPLCNSLCWLA